MKLSVCIPIYNFDVNELVTQLLSEITRSKLSVEIILIDDASDSVFAKKNKHLESLVSKFILLHENIGRSRIRNLFLNYASGDYLLFLDCDGSINKLNFLETYLRFINESNSEVAYGGRILETKKPNKDCNLRWKFATIRENLPVNVRNKEQYLNFQTNNFIIKKSTIEDNPFNESITQYGYEDLELAFSLKENKIQIYHIDNPIVNKDLETNTDFLSKADQSAKSLSQILKDKTRQERYNGIRLQTAFLKLRASGFLNVFLVFYAISKPLIVSKLLKGDCSLRYLDIYKLGQLSRYMRSY